MKTHDIKNDGYTIWVSASDGSCIGRFSRFGVDVHNTAEAMINGAPQCLECNHGLGYWDSWEAFKTAMIKHHKVWVPDNIMPSFVRVDMRLGDKSVLTVTDRHVLKIFGWDVCGDKPRKSREYPPYVAAAYSLWEHWYRQRMLRDRREESEAAIRNTVKYLLTGKIG